MVKCPLGVYAQISRSTVHLELKGLHKIAVVSSGEKACLITFACQELDEGLMIELTFASISNPIGGEVSLKLDGVGNLLSNHNPIESLFPTYQ